MRLRQLALAASAVVSACSLAAVDQDVEVLLPRPPAHWQIAFPDLCAALASRDASGAETHAVVSGWPARGLIRCARAVNVPILARPFVPGEAAVDAGVLRPAGGFYPLTLRRGEGRDVVALTWEDGPPALVLDRVAGAGRDLTRFNVERLRRYIRKAADPWSLDLDAVAQKIAQAEFTVWDIDPLPAWDVTVAPGAGTWFLESPFFIPAVAPGGSLVLKGVARGHHLLCSLSGERWHLQVGGEAVVVGRWEASGWPATECERCGSGSGCAGLSP